MATAPSVSVTIATLDGTRVAEEYEFLVQGDGLGTATFNVGPSRAELGKYLTL